MSATLHPRSWRSRRVLSTIGAPALLVALLGCGTSPEHPQSNDATDALSESGTSVRHRGLSVVGRNPSALELATLDLPGSSLRCTVIQGTRVTHLTWQSTHAPPAELTPIVIAARKDGGRCYMYLVAPDGSWTQPMGDQSFEAWHPSFSPNGTRVCFTRPPHPSDIWWMDLGGRRSGPVATGEGRSGGSAWSPTDPLIIWREGPYSEVNSVQFCRLDGSDLRTFVQGDFVSSGPEWSPDGQRIVYSTNESGNFEIYTRDLAGGTPVKLTNYPGDDLAPQWSPDGREILFVSTRGGPPATKRIYLMRTDGSDLRRLTETPSSHPDWSPDGRTICFRHRKGRKGDRERISTLKIIKRDGTGEQTLVGPPYYLHCCAWISRRVSRVFVGPPGADAGFDPPLGQGRKAVIAIRKRGFVRSVIGVSAREGKSVDVGLWKTTRPRLRLTSTAPLTIVESVWMSQPLVHHLDADQGVTQCIVRLDPQTGRVRSVDPR